MKYNVLILEDNEMDAKLIEQHLQRSEYNFQIKWVSNGEAYEEAIGSFEPDVIISDYRLKQYSGLDAIHYKNIECEEVPLIIVSGTIGEEKAVELIKNGATDFLIKNSISSRLVQAVIRALKESFEREKRKKAELELKSSEERLRMLFEHSMDGIVIGNPDNGEGVITANAAACEMLGYSLGEIRGKVLSDFYDTDGEDNVEKVSDPEETGFWRGELNIRRKDGSEIAAEASRRIVELKNGERRAYYIMRDISERRKYEAQIESEKAFTEKALNSLPGIFYVLDENHNYIRINDNVEKELGYGRDEMMQMAPTDFYFSEDKERIAKEIGKAFIDGQATTVARLKKKDDTSGYYFLTAAHFEQDRKNYILGTAINISDRIEAEKKNEESLKEKETLLTEIHHRVKNNLAVVSGMMQLQAFSSDDEEFCNKILNSVSRIKSIALIHEHLYQNESLSDIEVSSNLRELVHKIQETFNFKTEIEYGFDLETIKLNVNQAVPFALIINEITTNIYKHAFKDRSEGKVCIKLEETDRVVSLEIKDNGVGLPEDFDLKSAQTIGLTLINTLAQQLNAEVDLYSNKETIFRLKFTKSDVRGSSSSLENTVNYEV